MKKITEKQRRCDVRRIIYERNGHPSSNKMRNVSEREQQCNASVWQDVNEWVSKEIGDGLKVTNDMRGKKLKYNGLVIHLPETMNFSNNQDETVQCLTAIRKLVSVFEVYKSRKIPHKAYKLRSVNFDSLASISTSAALVLTAEVSKWNISIKKKLKPQVEKWHEDIYIQFEQLGFFDLFNNKPEKSVISQKSSPDVDFVRYVRGQCGNSDEAKDKKKELKAEISKLVGAKVDKWTILHSGLTEAVTNVTHHAYPGSKSCEEKSWYLTGSFNKSTNEMKIAFYDQGVGIPNSLPASEIWEKVLTYFTKLNIPSVEHKKHARLLEAAVSIDRTSTMQTDRGKGLQDLLEFIRERKAGYLSILSYHGLYKCWIDKGKEQSKTISMERPLNGTLIVWNVKLS
ncbi:hypothetical protein WNY79_03870 [Pseudoalteromonas sp. AS84]|uniref:hypothetical protein n=1 Tax=Pseudoalteromonas sp. AS84 TaxID=3135778 RepID=UPI003176715B